MCTATYLPLSPNGFILTHSRDEKAGRPAARRPQTVRIGVRDITFPENPQGYGTWIATDGPTTVCLLNGAFTAHVSKPPYKHRRGLVISHFFGYQSVDAFSSSYDFSAIEPFTLLIVEAGKLPGRRIIELRWNGHQLYHHELDSNRPHIWSSVTLYPAPVMAQRESWFQQWLGENPTPTVDAIRHFHQSAGDGDAANSLRMNRQNALLTISLTSLVHLTETVDFIYEDFTQQTFIQQTIHSAYAIA